MKFLIYLSESIIPTLIFLILIYGIVNKINVYDTFIIGAKNGVTTVFKIMPTLIGLMTAVGILRASGFLDFLCSSIEPFTRYIHFPAKLVPLSLVKMFSSSAATGLLLDLFKNYGPDSFLGLAASISMACTETIFYTMSIYFMTAKIKNSRYTLPGALFATIMGLFASVLLAQLLYTTLL